MICDLGDVVIVPFPFVDVAAEKRRPSVVLSKLSFNKSNGHSICAMITTAGQTKWPSDIVIEDIDAAGLKRPCVIRFKLFTLPNAIILRRSGTLARKDHNNVVAATSAIIS